MKKELKKQGFILFCSLFVWFSYVFQGNLILFVLINSFFCRNFAIVFSMDTLQQIRKPISADMDEYKQVFDSYLVHSNPILQKVLEAIGRRKGKMMRPMLTLLVAKLLGGKTNENTIFGQRDFPLDLDSINSILMVEKCYV